MLDHYKRANAQLGEALDSEQVQSNGSQLVAGANADNFVYKKAFQVAQNIFAAGKFSQASDAKDLHSKLDGAIADVQGAL